MFLLKSRRPARFGKWLDEVPPLGPPLQEDADFDLDGKLFEIRCHAEEIDADLADEQE